MQPALRTRLKAMNNVITVGVLTPHTTDGPRPELEQMAPTHIRVHVSRTSEATPAALDQAVSALPRAELDVLVLASSGTGYALGHDNEAALVRRLSERWGLPVCSTSRSAVAALRAHHIKRISLIHPPWFGSALNDLGADYFRSQGFEVIEALLADLSNNPDHIDPPAVVDWIADHLSPHADAAVIGGNGFRAAQAIQPLENRTGRLVLESNQVLLNSILNTTDTVLPITDYGRLLLN
jgi:maleate isomerase